MKDATPVQRRHAWNLCLALAFLALLARAIEKSPLNDATRQEQQHPAWTGLINVILRVVLSFALLTCLLMYERERRRTHDAPLESAWPPCLAHAVARLLACVLLATGQTMTCEAMTLNADIGGVGVLVGIYFPALLAMISLGIGHCHTREAGTKEIGIVLLANLVYLTFNLLKAITDVSRLSFADAIIAVLSIDATSAALSATMSNKDALAARTFVGVCALAQVFAAIAVIIAVATLGNLGAEQRITACCSRHVWWSTWTSCDYPGSNFWLYILLSVVTRGYDVATAFILAPKLDRAKKEAESKKADIQTDYERTVSTCSTRYTHHIPALLVNTVSLLVLLYRTGLKSSSNWTDWGQSATLITCVFGTCHWTYVCAPLLRIVDAMAETTDQKGRWTTCAQFWLYLYHPRRCTAVYVTRAVRAIMPSVIPDPQELTAERLGTKLVLAAKQGDLGGIREALIQGADIDWSQGPQGEGKTALIAAIEDSQDKVVKYLIEHGASQISHSEAYCKSSALHVAAKVGFEKIVKLLLEEGGMPSSSTRKVCDLSESVPEARSIPDYDTREMVDARRMTPLSYAVENHHFSLLETLNHTSETRIPWGYRAGKPSTMDAAVATQAAAANDTKGLLQLWRAGHLPLRHLRHTSILIRAIKCNDVRIEFVRLLCSFVDVNWKNQNGETPLQTACERHQLGVVAVLESGASPDIRNNRGDTILHNIAEVRVPEDLVIAKMLVEAGADVNALDDFGRSPVSRAAVGHWIGLNNQLVIQFLLDSGATPLPGWYDEVVASKLFGEGFRRRFVTFPSKETRVPADMITTRRQSLGDAYASAHLPSFYARNPQKSTPLEVSREKNWLIRVWGRLRSSREKGVIPWGFTGDIHLWSEISHRRGRSLADRSLADCEIDLPTLSGTYRGGIHCTMGELSRSSRPFLRRQLDKQLKTT
ncbi:hypothetical protein LTR27_007725 [Elasticomyces elasticus]|nr:hypothetical protein LTR27_007725 [Elasticomyces elasticus]